MFLAHLPNRSGRRGQSFKRLVRNVAQEGNVFWVLLATPKPASTFATGWECARERQSSAQLPMILVKEAPAESQELVEGGIEDRGEPLFSSNHRCLAQPRYLGSCRSTSLNTKGLGHLEPSTASVWRVGFTGARGSVSPELSLERKFATSRRVSKSLMTAS